MALLPAAWMVTVPLTLLSTRSVRVAPWGKWIAGGSAVGGWVVVVLLRKHAPLAPGCSQPGTLTHPPPTCASLASVASSWPSVSCLYRSAGVTV